MKKKCFTEEQIIATLKEVGARGRERRSLLQVRDFQGCLLQRDSQVRRHRAPRGLAARETFHRGRARRSGTEGPFQPKMIGLQARRKTVTMLLREQRYVLRRARGLIQTSFRLYR